MSNIEICNLKLVTTPTPENILAAPFENSAQISEERKTTRHDSPRTLPPLSRFNKWSFPIRAEWLFARSSVRSIHWQESSSPGHRVTGKRDIRGRPRDETKILVRQYATREASDLVRSSVFDHSGYDGRPINRRKGTNGRVGSKDRGWRGRTAGFTKLGDFRRRRQLYHDWQ
jgi:hypothetical protein